MVKMKDIDLIKNYANALKTKGENGLYKFAVGKGILRSTSIESPDIELLDISEKAFSYFRRYGNEEFFAVGKILRRAAHTLYRQLRRIKEDKPVNSRFLNSVK